MRFRTRIFLASFGIAASCLLCAALLISSVLQRELRGRIEQNLVAQTKVAGQLLEERVPDINSADLDAEADRLEEYLGVRVTLISPDGSIVGDSAQDGAALATLENTRARPEIQEAIQQGLGLESTTVGTDMLYAAVPVRLESPAFVRLALPLTAVEQQLGVIRNVTVVALLAALASALALAWFTSMLLSRRVRAIASVSKRYAAGDLSPSTVDYGNDEIGTVAKTMDDSVHELGRRLAELAKDRGLMCAILESMAEGILVVDEHGVVQMVNSAAVRMLRLDESARGQHYGALINHQTLGRQIESALTGRIPNEVEVTLGTSDDRTFVGNTAAFDTPGGSGVVLVLHDVSDLRRGDLIRRDFVANVSHELRTPLTAIRGSVDALLGPPNIDEREFVEIIARQTGRMTQLVNALLSLARLDEGHDAVDVTPCSVDAMFSDVLTDIAPRLEARRLHAQVRVDSAATTIEADADKLHHALLNLVDNAVNYAPEGTVIHLEAGVTDDMVYLSVADEGPGIPKADLPRVFERFFRVDRARSRHPGGTGLGLAIVKSLVELHGGAVRATNRPTGGAIFTICLPHAATERGGPAADSHEKSVDGRLHGVGLDTSVKVISR